MSDKPQTDQQDQQKQQLSGPEVAQLLISLGKSLEQAQQHDPKKTKLPVRPQFKKRYDFLPTKRAAHTSRIYGILVAIMSAFVIMGNILGAKIIHVGPFVIDAGILVFPIIWTVQDIFVQVYYKKEANFFCWLIAITNIVMVLMLLVAARVLPDAIGVSNYNVENLYKAVRRIFVASSVGYLTRALFNNLIYDAMRERTDERNGIAIRAIISSFVGRIADTILFTLIAFFGRQGVGFVWQAFSSFLIGSAIELVLSIFVTKPVSLLLINHLLSFQQPAAKTPPK